MTKPALSALLTEHAIEAHHVLSPHDDALQVARTLRTQAQPGARVMLAQRPQRSAWARIRGLWSKSDAADLVERLARGMLAAGLETPALVAETQALVAVCARVPGRFDPLDQVFLHEPRNL